MARFCYFKDVPDKEVKKRLDTLFNTGLLDSVDLGGCTSSDSWCFESEMSYRKQRMPVDEGKRAYINKWEDFRANPALRTAIRRILVPFKEEKSFSSPQDEDYAFRDYPFHSPR